MDAVVAVQTGEMVAVVVSSQGVSSLFGVVDFADDTSAKRVARVRIKEPASSPDGHWRLLYGVGDGAITSLVGGVIVVEEETVVFGAAPIELVLEGGKLVIVPFGRNGRRPIFIVVGISKDCDWLRRNMVGDQVLKADWEANVRMSGSFVGG
jgi:hypothetical protein